MSLWTFCGHFACYKCDSSPSLSLIPAVNFQSFLIRFELLLVKLTSMADLSRFFPIFTLLLLQLSCSGIMTRLANAQAPGQGSWCLPRPSTSDRELMANLIHACNVVNCTATQQGGPCFYPDTLINHASFAMNLYYQKSGANYWNCDFRKTAVIAVTDPSYGECIFEYAQ